jgi:hypothetical protein
MTKAEELGKKSEEEFTDDEWNYVMTMNHVEYKEYTLARSRDRGFIAHHRKADGKTD